ncbi:MAG TPA: right-handed parallel beta-helix repeat-containing protein [Dehalococcoidia bacterium]|jgi:hypothetical protein|nr:right-handed parallel beta-helix repeat-containing protein [Dehalococcoidia bacterium]
MANKLHRLFRIAAISALCAVGALIASSSLGVGTASAAQPLPPPSWDGTYYITQPGTYSGDASCPGIAITQHCVHLWNPAGITLEDFSVTTSGTAIQADSNSTIRNGTVVAAGGLTADGKVNVTIDNVTFNTEWAAVALYDSGGGCEGLSSKRSAHHWIAHSTFRSAAGNETVWIKCSQDITVEGNYFGTASQWSLSLPDSMDASIRGNYFDLWSGPFHWLAIELPRSFNVEIRNNTFTGPFGLWAVWLNSATNFVWIDTNCIQGGMFVLLGGFQSGSLAANWNC